MVLGAVHRSPGICLAAEKNPIKPQLGDPLMKGLCDQGPFPPNEVGGIAQHVRKGEGRKDGKDEVGIIFQYTISPILLPVLARV